MLQEELLRLEKTFRGFAPMAAASFLCELGKSSRVSKLKVDNDDGNDEVRRACSGDLIAELGCSQ